jgi:hypothetical protein
VRYKLVWRWYHDGELLSVPALMHLCVDSNRRTSSCDASLCGDSSTTSTSVRGKHTTRSLDAQMMAAFPLCMRQLSYLVASC